MHVNIFLKNIFVPEEEADDCIYQHYKGQLDKKRNNITSYQSSCSSSKETDENKQNWLKKNLTKKLCAWIVTTTTNW